MDDFESPQAPKQQHDPEYESNGHGSLLSVQLLQPLGYEVVQIPQVCACAVSDGRLWRTVRRVIATLS